MNYPGSVPQGQRVSMFVSHKVAAHKRAAARIKGILESRTERLDVHISEGIGAGTDWAKWIDEHIASAQILLVLLPHGSADLTWIANEIGRFQACCRNGRLVIVKRTADPVPDIVKQHQTVDASKTSLQEMFLEPLFRDPGFTGLDAALNLRVTNTDLSRDAQEIEQAISGIVDAHSDYYSESLVIETVDADLSKHSGIAAAPVWAPNGCRHILNWDLRSFTWKQLRVRAEQDKGKGTFWVDEIENVVIDVAAQNVPCVMSSTFRGRGALGQIFQPQLDHVDKVDDKPVRFHFVFREVLAPELVRGQGEIGLVFNLMRIAGRVRWEVLDPFVMNRWLSRAQPPGSDEQPELIGRIAGSLRAIELEVDRAKMLPALAQEPGGLDPELVRQILSERECIKKSVDSAISEGDFEVLMKELTERLEFQASDQQTSLAKPAGAC